MSSTHLLAVNLFRLLNATSNTQSPSTVAPVLVKFGNKYIAYTVYKAKSKLAKSGIFVSEYLTKVKKSVLEGARYRFGAKNVWTDRGRIFKREQSDLNPVRIRSLKDAL